MVFLTEPTSAPPAFYPRRVPRRDLSADARAFAVLRRCARRKRKMDDLDHAILREFGRGQVLLWGGMDPRLSAAGIADRLGVDRNTIRLRVRAWARAGFLRRFVALPNPQL